jgi:hypothetical protein
MDECLCSLLHGCKSIDVAAMGSSAAVEVVEPLRLLIEAAWLYKSVSWV